MGGILVSCRDRAATEREYLPALRRAGWTGSFAFLHPGDPLPRLEGLDGLLLTGGHDIHPRHWDPAEAVHPAADVDEARDALELPLVREAWSARRPLLGICRGEQILNVALGGSLIQDIPSHFGCPPERHQHGSAAEPGELHLLDLVPDTRLAALLGAASVPANSRHHQAVRRVAPGLKASAWDPGTQDAQGPLIEAVEAADPGRWVLGVQWHPENLVRREDAAGSAARALFAGFLAAVGRHRAA